MTATNPFARPSGGTHMHIQRMRPAEVAAIDAEIERLAAAGVETTRTGIVRAGLSAYFALDARERTRAARST